MCIFRKKKDKDLLLDLKAYVDKNFVVPKFKKSDVEPNDPKSEKAVMSSAFCVELPQKTDLTFSNRLMKFIDDKSLSDVECYKKANIDRKLFSKIRGDANYQPRKNTVFAFVVALQLNLEEAEVLLKSAGYSLSHSFKSDLIIEYFIKKQMYDINKINIALDEYGEQPLGSL